MAFAACLLTLLFLFLRSLFTSLTSTFSLHSTRSHLLAPTLTTQLFPLLFLFLLFAVLCPGCLLLSHNTSLFNLCYLLTHALLSLLEYFFINIHVDLTNCFPLSSLLPSASIEVYSFSFLLATSLLSLLLSFRFLSLLRFIVDSTPTARCTRSPHTSPSLSHSPKSPLF